MHTYIEERFRLIAETSGNAILAAQWEYDKQLIPEALKSVSTIFPHFSVHDENHSISILNNIYNILGKQAIDKFSSIDLWFLLEAAYCHDLGMVITSDMLKTAISEGELTDYIRNIQSDKNNPL